MTTTKTENIGVRLPAQTLERVDAFAKEYAAANPGVKVSRSDAIRVLLLRALDAPKGKRSK